MWNGGTFDRDFRLSAYAPLEKLTRKWLPPFHPSTFETHQKEIAVTLLEKFAQRHGMGTRRPGPFRRRRTHRGSKEAEGVLAFVTSTGGDQAHNLHRQRFTQRIVVRQRCVNDLELR